MVCDKNTQRLLIALLFGVFGLISSCPALALDYSDFSIFGDQRVVIGDNAKIGALSDPDNIYHGKIGTNSVAASPFVDDLDLGSNIKSGDLYSAGSTSIDDNSQIDGKIVSNGKLHVGSHVTITGPVNSGGATTIGQNSEINSDIIAAGHTLFAPQVHVAGNVLSGLNMTTEENGKFDADAGVNGNVTLGANTEVLGHVTHSGTLTLQGISGSKATVGSESTGTSTVIPETFSPITLPSVTNFSAGGSDLIKSGIQDISLTPGTYGSLSLDSNNKLRLTSGDYYFDDIYAAENLKLYLDLSGGDLSLFVAGDVYFGQHLSVYLTNGTVNGIFAESHGAWTMDDLGSWYGTIYTPYDKLTIGEFSEISGALYSGDEIDFKEGSKLRYYSSNHFGPYNDPPSTESPEPSTFVLLGISLVGWGFIKKKSAVKC